MLTHLLANILLLLLQRYNLVFRQPHVERLFYRIQASVSHQLRHCKFISSWPLHKESKYLNNVLLLMSLFSGKVVVQLFIRVSYFPRPNCPPVKYLFSKFISVLLRYLFNFLGLLFPTSQDFSQDIHNFSFLISSVESSIFLWFWYFKIFLT